MRAWTDVAASRSGALLVLALLALPSTVAAQPADAETVRLRFPSCTPDWFDADALVRALVVETSSDGLRIAQDGALELTIDLSCDPQDDASVALSMLGETRSVALGDLAPSVRMRALALAGRDFVGEVRGHHARSMPVSEPPPPSLPPPPAAQDPERPPAATPPPAVTPPPEASPPWLTLTIAARGQWLGTRVVAPAASLELDARLPDLPVSLYVAVDGLYAVAQDMLGEIRAFDLGVRGGARATLDVSPVRLSLALGALLAYARAEATGHADVRSGSLDGALVGIDGGVTGAIALSSDVSLVVGVGVVAYLVGIEARAETRPIISFRDAAPWASLGVGFALEP